MPIKIWDTAGQERFKTLTSAFYRKADGIIISFAVTDRQSFLNVRNWVDSIKTHATPTAARVLVGNKIDLAEQREVTEAEAQELARQHGIEYHEASAKANIGLKETFEDIFEQSYKNKFMSTGEADPAQAARKDSVRLKGKGRQG